MFFLVYHFRNLVERIARDFTADMIFYNDLSVLKIVMRTILYKKYGFCDAKNHRSFRDYLNRLTRL